MMRFAANWLMRHQHPASRVLHALAIPMLPVAVYLALKQGIDGAWGFWWRPVALLVVSYALQYFGHRMEGNDMGEMILVKKLLGQPYVAVSPRYVTAIPSRSVSSISQTEQP